MNIREKLIKLRDENKLSQQELADMLDVSRQTVSRWESGKSVPSSVQLSNLCKAFNIDANNLFDPDAELTADSAVRQPDGVNVKGAKRNIALPLTVGVLLLAAFAGLIVTIIYAVKDAVYDSGATVWIVSIPQNTPMIVLSVFLAVFIVLLAVALVILLRRKKK